MRHYRRNQFQLTQPEPQPGVVEARATIGGLTILGVVVNPKLKEPVLVTTDGDYVGIRSLQADAELKKLGRGFFESDSNSDYAESANRSGYPRVHTPDGVTVKGRGYGTCLYTGACLAAHLKHDSKIEIDAYKSGDGISSSPASRSASADAWWDAALEQDLVDREQDEGEDETEENVDVRVRASDLDACLSDQIEGTITYVNQVNVDVTKPGEGFVYDVYPYDNATSHDLVIANWAIEIDKKLTPVDQLPHLWATIRDEADSEIYEIDKTALMALDVRNLSPDAVRLIATLYAAAGWPDRDVSAMMERWQHGLDPGAEARQRYLFTANQRGAMDKVLEARSITVWDNLSELP